MNRNMFSIIQKHINNWDPLKQLHKSPTIYTPEISYLRKYIRDYKLYKPQHEQFAALHITTTINQLFTRNHAPIVFPIFTIAQAQTLLNDSKNYKPSIIDYEPSEKIEYNNNTSLFFSTYYTQSYKISNKRKSDAARHLFSQLIKSYENIHSTDLFALQTILNQALKTNPETKSMKICTETNIKRNPIGLDYAEIFVQSNYFRKREAITFNRDGFIGFAGWACTDIQDIFVDGFVKWLDLFPQLINIDQRNQPN